MITDLPLDFVLSTRYIIQDPVMDVRGEISPSPPEHAAGRAKPLLIAFSAHFNGLGLLRLYF